MTSFSHKCDVLILGGGIIGAACAYEASSRGLRTIVVDKSDFGSETSANSFKIIHGGLRYLQHLDYSRLKESAREQGVLLKNAPHLIKPLPFLVPSYGFGKKSKLALKAACSIYEALGRERNAGVVSELKLPSHKILTDSDVRRIAPHINHEGLNGGLVFYDCQMRNPDRLTLSVLKSAEKCGATLYNYYEVLKIHTNECQPGGAEISHVECKNIMTGQNENIQSRFVINAMGPWAESVGNLIDNEKVRIKCKPQLFSKGIQLVVPEIIKDYAVAIEGRGSDKSASLKRGNRSFFFQPWRGVTLIGTTDTVFEGDPSKFSITLDEIREFLHDVKEVYPDSRLEPINVQYAFGGLRAISSEARQDYYKGVNRDGMVNTTRHEYIIDHEKTRDWGGVSTLNNLISVLGVKYTTFRKVGALVLSLLENKGVEMKSSTTLVNSIYGAPESNSLKSFIESKKNNFNFLDSQIEFSLFEELALDYGEEVDEIFCLTEKMIQDKNMLPEDALLYSQVCFAIESEYAKTLADVILRRLPKSALGFPGRAYIKQVGTFMAQRLDWDSARLDSEIKQVISRFNFHE